MDLLDRLLAHDTWTTRQLIVACQALPDEMIDRDFEIDHRSIRKTFIHIVDNMEVWTDLISEHTVQKRTGETLPELLERLSVISREFTNVARKVAREQRFDDCFLDTLDNPPRLKTFGGAIGHLITHSMHHRAQIMFMMEKVGLESHIEGDLLGWESLSFGWRS